MTVQNAPVSPMYMKTFHPRPHSIWQYQMNHTFKAQQKHAIVDK